MSSEDDVIGSVEEVAKEAGVSERSVYRWIKLGLIQLKPRVVTVINGVSLKQIISVRDREKPAGGRPSGSKS